jgi:TrmH family RNA methyltransferase
MISSFSNPRVKQARALRQRKARQESGLFLVEGTRHIGEALQAGAEIQTIFFAPGLLDSGFGQTLLERAATTGIECLATSPEVFASLAEKEHPQGLLAVVRQADHDLENLNPKNCAWGVALVAPQDPGNIGAILRTIDAVGARGLVLIDEPADGRYSADPYHPSCVRASMGALFWLPVVTTTFEYFPAWSLRHGYHIYGTSAHAKDEYHQVGRYERPAILLLGSEQEGLTVTQAAICEKLVRLPMLGHVTSLNLAVAAGTMLYAMMPES